MGDRRLGDAGEQLARRYLKENGYKIDSYKWRRSRFEIDIVASRKDVLVFVEVKTARDSRFGEPEYKVTASKQKRVAEAASEYLSELESIPENIRFDVISIIWPQEGKPVINHIESAFTVE